MAEKDTVKAIIRAIKDSGGYAIKHHGSHVSEAGTPDILACYKGLAILIEVKEEGRKPTKIQRARLRQWKASGALTMWCDHIEPVKKLLRMIDHALKVELRSDWKWKVLQDSSRLLAENGKARRRVVAGEEQNTGEEK